MEQQALEKKFKYICFALAVLALFSVGHSLYQPQLDVMDLLSALSLFFISIELAVLMTYEQLSAKLSFKSLFQLQAVSLSPIGVLALTLGKIGMFLMFLSITYDVYQLLI